MLRWTEGYAKKHRKLLILKDLLSEILREKRAKFFREIFAIQSLCEGTELPNNGHSERVSFKEQELMKASDPSGTGRKKKKRHSDTIPFRLGLFSEALAALRFGLTKRQVNNYRKAKKIPVKYAAAVYDMGDAVVLPIDTPPPVGLIGQSAHRAIEALQRGDPEAADALSAKGMRSGARSWTTGAVNLEEPTKLKWFFARAANGMAWSQHKQWMHCDEGLPAMLRLHREVFAHVREHEIDNRRSDWAAWRYLMVTTTSYAVAYYVARAGLGYFLIDRPATAERYRRGAVDQKRDARKFAAKVLLSKIAAFEEEEERFAQESIMTLRLAWNILQLASLADDDAAFVKSFQAMEARHEGPVSELFDILMDDEDTRRMLAKRGVQGGLLSQPEPPPEQ